MNGAALAALITAGGSALIGTIGAYLSILNRRDATAQAKVDAELRADAAELAASTASREELLAIIAAQREFNDTTVERLRAITEDYARLAESNKECRATCETQAEQIAHLTESIVALGGTP